MLYQATDVRRQNLGEGNEDFVNQDECVVIGKVQ